MRRGGAPCSYPYLGHTDRKDRPVHWALGDTAPFARKPHRVIQGARSACLESRDGTRAARGFQGKVGGPDLLDESDGEALLWS